MVDESDAGAVAEKRRRKRMYRTIGSVIAVGFGGGLAYGYSMAHQGGDPFEGPMQPSLALLLMATWLAAMIGGSWYYLHHVDELEKHNNLWGMAAGGTVLMIAYPAWYLLWRGGFVAEPTHEALFLTLYIVAIIAYLIKKFR